MRRIRVGSWSRPALFALAALLLGPAMAHAQLFPRMNIKRERVPCAVENPAYKMQREMYYGYYPTCWRKFPPGWGCPSPEGPDLISSLKAVPLPTRTPTGSPLDDTTLPPAGNINVGPGRDKEMLPALPAEGRSLFDKEDPKPPAGATPPAAKPNDLDAPAGATPPAAKPGAAADASTPRRTLMAGLMLGPDRRRR